MIKIKLSETHKLIIISILFICVGAFSSLSPFGLFAGNLTGLLVMLISLPTLLVSYKWLGKSNFSLLLIILILYTFVIEITAQKTGIIYGGFQYSDLLGYKILDSVPWHVPLGYIPIILGSIVPAYYLSTRFNLNILIPMTLWILLVDIAIDPIITFSGYWNWHESGLFFGVPISNFLGWLLTGFISSILLVSLIKEKIDTSTPPYGLIVSTLINVSFWSGYAIANGLFLPSIVGSLIILALLILNKVY